jgi:hypothetical protein
MKPRNQVYPHQVPYTQGQTRGKEDSGGNSRIRTPDNGEDQKRKRRKKKKTFARVIFCPLLRYFLQNSALKDP